MFRLGFVASLLASVLILGCDNQATDPGPNSKDRDLLVSLSTSDREVLRLGNGFGWKLFAKLAGEDEGGNLFVSPLGVSIALTMAYNGARGETEAAFGRVLGYVGMDRSVVNALYAKLAPALTEVDPKVTLSIANSIWSAPGFEAEQDFLDQNKTNFQAETRTLDFASDAAAGVLNEWVSGKTRGLITRIADAPLDPAMVMMLLNAIYFKGAWSKSFDPASTFDGVFHQADGSDVSCRMMTAENKFRYFQNSIAKELELPYGDSLFSMVLLQPAEGATLPNLVAALGSGAWEDWIDSLGLTEGVLQLPKFKLEWGKSIAGSLKAMGLETAFQDGADFTGIRHTGGLRISDVIHKTCVSVDEQGTEAAAVTRVDVVDTAAPLINLIRFDRPFVFAIRERNSGAILFMGRLMAPTL
jgi:serine protease inhibitor